MAEQQEYASIEELLEYEDMGAIDIVIKSWGGKLIQVRPLMLSELSRIRKEVSHFQDEQDQRDALYQRMLAVSAVQPRFTDDQARFVWSKSARAGVEIIEGLNRANGLSGTDEEEAARKEADERSFPGGPGPLQPVVAGVGNEGAATSEVGAAPFAPRYSNLGGVSEG